jgi:hypothetical protein
LPVNLTREWQHSLLEGLMTKVVSKLLTQSERFIEWIILAMVGLIAIVTMAAVAGVALQTSILTHEFVTQWQNQSYMQWSTQSKINEEIEIKIRDVQQAVSWLGDQIVNIQHQLMLSCDWNVTCIVLLQQNIMLPDIVGNK